MWTIIASAAFWNLLAAFAVLGPVVAKRSLGGPAAWAAILTAEGIGWLAGGVTLLRATPRRPLILATAASVVAVVPTLLLAVPAPLAVIVLARLFAGGLDDAVQHAVRDDAPAAHPPARAFARELV